MAVTGHRELGFTSGEGTTNGLSLRMMAASALCCHVFAFATFVGATFVQLGVVCACCVVSVSWHRLVLCVPSIRCAKDRKPLHKKTKRALCAFRMPRPKGTRGVLNARTERLNFNTRSALNAHNGARRGHEKRRQQSTDRNTQPTSTSTSTSTLLGLGSAFLLGVWVVFLWFGPPSFLRCGSAFCQEVGFLSWRFG